jgi:hypothetical protein
VKPQQKQAMVRALQSRGHVVAMTGDGVNDVLALKDADLGISMGSGSEATKAVADLVLTDNAFSSLPTVVNEGRKVINNVERVSNLFVTKAAYAVLLTFVVGLLNSPFPFLPRQLTLIGTFSIGVPGFFLALAPEVDLIRPGFLRRVLRFSIPAGVIAGSATLAAYEAALHVADLELEQARTLATVTMLAIGLVVLAVTSRPLRPWKLGLIAAMGAGYGVVFLVPFLRDYFRRQRRLVADEEEGPCIAVERLAATGAGNGHLVTDPGAPGPVGGGAVVVEHDVEREFEALAVEVPRGEGADRGALAAGEFELVAGPARHLDRVVAGWGKEESHTRRRCVDGEAVELVTAEHDAQHACAQRADRANLHTPERRWLTTESLHGGVGVHRSDGTREMATGSTTAHDANG